MEKVFGEQREQGCLPYLYGVSLLPCILLSTYGGPNRNPETGAEARSLSGIHLFAVAYPW